MNQLCMLTIALACLLHVAVAIKCYQCEPDPEAGEFCQRPTNITTCDPKFDACATFVLRVAGISIAGMTCGQKAICDLAAKQLNCSDSGLPDDAECSTSCCQKDLCNGPPTEAPTSAAGRAHTAKWGAIFTTAVLSLRLFQANM